jgi:TorA maturation chaperone TorD
MRSSAAEVAFQRGRIYELLSYLFWSPSREYIEFIQEGGLEDTFRESLAVYPLREKIDTSFLQKAVADLGRMPLEALQACYETLETPRLKILYECRYHQPFCSHQEMADVAGFYRAFGFTFAGERPDHISYELDFMRLLALKEAVAELDGNREARMVCLEAERAFLRDHLGRWVHLLVGATEAMDFYSPMARLLQSWVRAECAYRAARPEPLGYPLERLRDDGAEPLNFCIKEAKGEGLQ